MSEAAKAARAANKAKAKRLSDGDPKAKVDASSWTPPEMMNTEKKTGLRPVSRRAYKRGGKVHGEVAAQNAGRKPRKSSGDMPTATAIANAKVNRNVKHANAEEFGQPHVGGYANGGYAKGGRPAKLEGGTVSRYRDKAYDEMEDAENAKASRRGDRTVAKNADAIIRRRAKGIEMAERRLGDDEYKRGGRTKKMGGGPMGDPRVAAADRMAAATQQAGVPSGRMTFTERQGTPLPGSGMKKGGRAKKADGGMSAPPRLTAKEMRQTTPSRPRGPMGDFRDYVPPTDPSKDMGSDAYLRKSNPLDLGAREPDFKRGGKIKNFEGSAKDEAQDKKLAKKRGMSMKAWEASKADAKHDKQQSMAGLKQGGRAGRATGGRAAKSTGGDILKAISPISMLMNKGGKAGNGNYTGGTRPTGGRIAKASGGLLSSLMGGSKASSSSSKGKGKKKGTNISIVINAGQKPADLMAGLPMLPPGKPPMLPPAMSAGAPAPAVGMDMPPPDMGGGAPGGPPGGGLGAMLGRKAGGRVGHRSYSSYKDMDAGAGGGLGRLEKTEIAKKTYKK